MGCARVGDPGALDGRVLGLRVAVGLYGRRCGSRPPFSTTSFTKTISGRPTSPSAGFERGRR